MHVEAELRMAYRCCEQDVCHRAAQMPRQKSGDRVAAQGGHAARAGHRVRTGNREWRQGEGRQRGRSAEVRHGAEGAWLASGPAPARQTHQRAAAQRTWPPKGAVVLLS